jgi:hypothetical protein
MADDKEKAAGGGKSSSLLTKIIGAVFGAVIAPILVAVGIKFLSPAEHAPATQPAVIPPPTARAPEPVKPPPSGNLITANLTEHFYSYGWSTEANKVVRNDQVDPRWFQFISEPPGPNPLPSIHVPGNEKVGYLGTKDEFENYTLYVWWKWGEKTFGQRAENARWAALLLHVTGPDGAIGIMPQSVVVHFREGQVGNIRLLGPEDAIKCQARVKQIPGQDRPVYDRDAPAIRLASTGSKPRELNGKGWDGTIYRRGFDEEEFEDRRKDPGKQPAGWHRVQIDCDRGTITVHVAGKVVNEITNCNLTRGRIGFTSQGAEWYIGKIELIPKSKPSGGE